MPITQQEVKYVADLARLGLTEEELSHFQGQLELILEYVDKLKQVAVDEIPPTSHVLDLKNVYRTDDAKRPACDAGRILENAPQKEGRFIKVPRVIE